MPEGISVVVDDEGFASITFEDRTLRGPALDRLIKLGGPETIEKSTEDGYPVYRVPEGNARAVGLLDDSAPISPAADDTPADPASDATGGDGQDDAGHDDAPPAPEILAAFPEGEPTDDWHLNQLKAYAASKGLDAHELRSKAKVLALINGTA